MNDDFIKIAGRCGDNKWMFGDNMGKCLMTDDLFSFLKVGYFKLSH